MNVSRWWGSPSPESAKFYSQGFISASDDAEQMSAVDKCKGTTNVELITGSALENGHDRGLRDRESGYAL